MKLPLNQYENILDLKFIPSDQFITSNEVFILSDREITELQTYCYYTFPEYITNNINDLVILAIKILEQIPTDSVVLVPGDSPSKLILLLKLLYEETPNLFHYDDNYKQIKFIMFPISGLSDSVNDKLLDKYLAEIIIRNNVSPNDKLVYLDYILGGGTYRAIKNSLSRIFNDQNIRLEKFNIANISDVIITSENTHSRCVTKYNLGTELININVKRCNAIVTFFISFVLRNGIGWI